MSSTIYPKVTVLIAHHNYQEYLGRAIQSAKNQTYKNLQICIVDTSDDFESVKKIVGGPKLKEIPANNDVKAYQVDNILLIRLSGGAKGPSHNRNVGIACTKHDTSIYVMLDADDEMYPTKVEKFVNAILSAPTQIGVVYADTDILNVQTGILNREYREPYDINRLIEECIVHSGAGVSTLALNAVFENTGWYDNTMRTCEDYDLWMRISEKFMIVHLPEALTLVRIQPKNSTATVDKSIWQNNWKKVYQKRYERQNQS